MQSGLFENEIRPGMLEFSAERKKNKRAAGMPKTQSEAHFESVLVVRGIFAASVFVKHWIGELHSK